MQILLKSITPSFFKRAFFLSFILILSFSCVAFAENKKSVLLISSYHPGFPTFFQQVNGLKSLLDSRKVSMDIEFMDTKRFPDKANWENFEKSLSYKLNKSNLYDVILVADDNAFLFALGQQEKLFKNKPIVFFGVNNVDLAIRQNSNPNVTGVVEAVSMNNTIELMIKLRPKAKKIIALVDNTPSGQGDLKRFYNEADSFKSHKFSEISASGLTWAEFYKRLGKIEKGDAVLLLSAYKDKNNTTLLFNKSLKGIKENLKVPLFHLWFHGIGDGIVGGDVINHFEQGKAAAKIVNKILGGKPIGQIKVVQESPNQSVFDYNEIQTFNLDQSKLPVNTMIMNKPKSFYKEHKEILWFIITLFTILAVVLFITVLFLFNRKLRKDVFQATQDLREHAEVVEKMNEDLSYRNKELDEFTYIASHDLQEPLRKISAFSSLLEMELDGELTEDAQENLNFLTDAAKRMQTLVNDLLVLSRSGRREMKSKSIPLDRCVDSAIESLDLMRGELKVKINRDELPEIWGDETIITQLYQNLISNGIKFNKNPSPELTLTSEEIDGTVVLGVLDNGIGIPEKYQDQIFAPFKKLHGRSEYEGTGIGLSICRKAVERHNGKIWVESEKGKGCHFKFTLGTNRKD